MSEDWWVATACSTNCFRVRWASVSGAGTDGLMEISADEVAEMFEFEGEVHVIDGDVG